jgi:predicted RNA-binding Zn ribbon-like protein
MTDSKKFPLISGHLSLDLVNTELVRRGQRHNLLVTEEDVMEWLELMKDHTIVIDQSLISQAKERSAEVFSSLLLFRSILRENFESLADGHSIPDEFIDFLEKKVEKAPFTYKLINQKLIPTPIGESENVLLSLIAFDALTLIGENLQTFLKRCSNPECVLLFLDKSGRRKWCSMKICGNRTKVARFQQKLD